MSLENLIIRRDELKQEHERGTKIIKEKEAEIEQLRQTMRRIARAIEALEEVIEEQKKKKGNAGESE